MSKFRASFCDPLNPSIIEIGDIEEDKILTRFDSIPWKEFLQKMENVSEDEIHYSPSLEVENKISQHGLSVSAIDGKEWYIFYKRPKHIKKLFGLINHFDQHHVTDATGQTIEQVRKSLQALIDDDLGYLDKHIR